MPLAWAHDDRGGQIAYSRALLGHNPRTSDYQADAPIPTNDEKYGHLQLK